MGAGGRLEGYYLGYQDSPPIGLALCAVHLKLSPSCLTGCNQSLELYSKHLNLSPPGLPGRNQGLALCLADLDMSPPGLPGLNRSLALCPVDLTGQKRGIALCPADLKLSLSCLSGHFNRSGFVSKTLDWPRQAI